MKRLSLSFMLMLLVTQLWAQFTVQGVPYTLTPEQQQRMAAQQAYRVAPLADDDGLLPFDQLDFWVGEGKYSAGFTIQWNVEAEKNCIAWGYRFDTESVTGEKIILDIVKADPRLYTMCQTGTQYGTAIAAFGYDANNDGNFSVSKDGVTYYPDENGVIYVDSYSFDGYVSNDPEDYWQSGWYEGYWSYWIKDDATAAWSYSGTGATGRTVKDGGWDGWNFAAGMNEHPWKPMVSAQPVVTIGRPVVVAVTPEMADASVEGADLPEIARETQIIKITLDRALGDDEKEAMQVTLRNISGESVASTAKFADNSIEVTVTRVLPQAGDTVLLDLNLFGETIATRGAVVVNTEIVNSCPADLTKGIFFVNEDWFGHDYSSVNYLDENNKMHYRAYRAANPLPDGGSEVFGITTQYGCIHDGKFYFVSKQANNATEAEQGVGGRLIVADALTLKKVASFEDIGGGDGRSFLGINVSKGYIGTSNGIRVFDIANMKVGNLIEGTGNETGGLYSNQIGTMVKAGEYVFAVKQSTGICVIDPKADKIAKTIEATNAYTLTVSKDGQVWAALTGTNTSRLLRIDPQTLDTTGVALPENITLSDSWGAWNAGNLCAAYKSNALYFSPGGMWGSNGSVIVRYDIDSNTFDTDFYILPNQDGQYKEMFYGASFRVNPANDQLVLTTSESGWLTHYQNNWVRFVDGTTGELLNTVRLSDYYWFPALPVFPDMTRLTPVTGIALNHETAVLTMGTEETLTLTATIAPADATDQAVLWSSSDETVATVSAEGVVTAVAVGEALITATTVDGGFTATCTVTVKSQPTALNEASMNVAVYPNPVTDFVNIAVEEVTMARLYSITGNLMWSGMLQVGVNTVDMTNLPAGVYSLQVSNRVVKIVK